MGYHFVMEHIDRLHFNPKRPAVMINSWQVLLPAYKRTLRYPRFPMPMSSSTRSQPQMNVTAARVTSLKFMLAVAIAVEKYGSSLMVIMLCVLGTSRYIQV